MMAMIKAHINYLEQQDTGNALVFKNGKEIKATWKKADRTSRTILTDASGNEITFTAGKLWFEVLGIGSEVDVK